MRGRVNAIRTFKGLVADLRATSNIVIIEKYFKKKFPFLDFICIFAKSITKLTVSFCKTG